MNAATLNSTELDKADKAFTRFFNKALLFQSNTQYEQAIEYYEKAISLKPDHLPTRQVLGYLYQITLRFPEALAQYRHAITLHRHSATLQNSAGLCEERCKNLPAAKQHYLTATRLKQDNSEALNNLGNICRKMGDYKEAETYLLAALRLKISVETLANLGIIMNELGESALALSFYDHALRLQPDNPQLRWNKSLVLLSEGSFDQGWFLYDQGKFAKTRPKQKSPQIDNKTKYSIEYFRNKSVIIKGEQGIGDEVMFASCISDIIDVAKKCTIECDDRLVPLFQRSFPNAVVLTEYDGLLYQERNKEENIEIDKKTDTSRIEDVTISMGSLPRFIRRDFNEFPVIDSYLLAFPKAVSQWRQRYLSIPSRQRTATQAPYNKHTETTSFNVGISWQGGINDEKRRRSTQLIAWENLLTKKNTNFINLQYGDISKETDFIEHYLNEWPDTNHYHNIEQLAAQIAALDLVITVSNVTAHLAGALGIPVFIMLPKAPNWRWFRGKNPSPWYKSATLFTQEKVDEWDSVFNSVEEALSIKLEAWQKSKNEEKTREKSREKINQLDTLNIDP